MQNSTFHQIVIFDIKDLVYEFMSIYKPGNEPLDQYDIVFVEEVLTVTTPSLLSLEYFEKALSESMIYFMDQAIHYRDNLNTPRLLMEAASQLAQNLVMKINSSGGFIDGHFPYVFKQLTPSLTIIFELAPEYLNERYCNVNNSFSRFFHT